jgi:putative drug exporter of the RND superfamily
LADANFAARWTHTVIRVRWPIVVLWLAVVLVGGWASGRLSDLQSNVFSVPGTDSERVRDALENHFGDRSDGAFTVVFRVPDSSDSALRARLQRAVDRAANAVPTGKGTALEVAGPHVLYGNVISTLNLAEAKSHTDDLVEALGQPPGAQAYVTGAPAIQNDLDPIFSKDLQKGESIALPIALVVLLLVFGLSWAVTIPFLFAASTVFGTLGIVYVIAHYMTTPTYVTNLVFLIGLGIAIDYSLLIVYRFREELSRPWPAEAAAERSPAPPPPDAADGTVLSGPVPTRTVPSGPAPPAAPQEREGVAHGRSVEEAIVRTMQTAGRAVIFSGATVAIGLALLLFMPLPFMRAMGVGGFLIPVVSIAAAATLQPALLSLYGRRGTHRVAVAAFLRGRVHVPVRGSEHPDDVEHRFWARLARSIMRRKWRYVLAIGALLVAASIPVAWLQLTPGATAGIPQSPQSVRGLKVLEAALGPGAIAPAQVLVDSGRPGGVQDPAIQAAIARLVSEVGRDPEVSAAYYADAGRFVDPTAHFAQVIVATRHEYGSEAAQSFVHRLRGDLIPAARFPPEVKVRAGGGPPQGVDFISRAYGTFPWLVLAVLALTYVLLTRAFRSVFLPLKAVVLNLLSVAASYGALVVVFRFGVGKDLLGLYQFPQIEGWIPIFLFAMLFGLSMDYEVFLVSRMREAWDETHDNARAVAIGLERTGRIVTAAAVIMVAAFSGFMAGSIVGLQEFGCGLAVAIFLDATLVRAVLVPSMMAILGRYNWWLPPRVARLVRVRPSPLVEAR